MRREGRQHGMVRSHTISPPPSNPAPGSKVVNRFDTPPTAGFLTKVLPKPTNHSKYTGKCRRARCAGCHSHPISKSRDKAKGAYKLKSCNVALNHRLVAWRVVDTGTRSSCWGISATGILGHLSGDRWDEAGDGVGGGDESVDLLMGCSDEKREEEEVGADMIDGGSEDDDGEMGFFEVGFVVEHLDGEDWCAVREM